MNHRSKALVGLMLTTLFACKKEDNSFENSLKITENQGAFFQTTTLGKYVPNQILVKFKSGASEKDKESFLAALNGTISERIITNAMKKEGDTEGLIVINTQNDASEGLKKAKLFPIVEVAELNYYCTTQSVSNDPFVQNGSLWNMLGGTPDNMYGCQASTAWANNQTGSKDVYVGVIDQGIMLSHDDLKDNIGINTGEIPNNRKDDDGNGYEDDYNGWNFISGDDIIFDDANTDNHGTHIAGIIGAKGGNGIGVAGVNWNVKMLSGKFIGKKGGTVADAIKVIDYFVNLKTRVNNPLNIVALNNSWATYGYSQLLRDAIERANAADILFIAGAGNGGGDGKADNNDINASACYPASYDNSNIISVAAITPSGELPAFSNYGAKSVDIAAPGVNIYSTVSDRSVASVYASYSGTSMATAHVTGAAALYKALNPSANAAQIKAAILNSGTSLPSLEGKCVSGKTLNISNFYLNY
jgi:subtilisin family serine protease